MLFRSAPRQRTRLRSGKLVTVGGEFLTECLIYDLSSRGCRIRLPAGRPLPRAIQLLDDQSGLLHRCALLWRDGSDIGVRFDVQAETRGGVDANASKKHLQELAKKLDISGRSKMDKDELAKAIDKANQKANAKSRS